MRLYGWVLAIVYLLGRTAILLFSPGPQSYPDSPGYRVLVEGSSWSAVSFTGQASRLWGVPAFYALLPSDTWRVVFQWAIATLAWGGLAWVLWQRHRAFAARAVAATAVAFLAVLPQVSLWDFAILSESLSISLGVAALALLLRWRDNGRNTLLVALILVSIWWAFTRFETAVLLVFMVMAIAWLGLRDRAKRLPAALAVIAMCGTLAWVFGLNMALERNTRWSYSGGGIREELVVYRLGWQVYHDPRLERIYTEELGMPDCPGLANQARTQWAQAEILTEYKNCPQLGRWARENGNSLLGQLAIAAPGDFLRTTVPLLSQVYYGRTDITTGQAIPPGVDWLVFPPDELSLEVSALALALLVIAGFFVSRTAAVLAVASMASSAVLLAVSCSSLSRLGIQETLLIRLGLIILAAAAIDRLSGRAPREDRLVLPRQRQASDSTTQDSATQDSTTQDSTTQDSATQAPSRP